MSAREDCLAFEKFILACGVFYRTKAAANSEEGPYMATTTVSHVIIYEGVTVNYNFGSAGGMYSSSSSSFSSYS